MQPNKNDDMLPALASTANIAALTMGTLTLSTGGNTVVGGFAIAVGSLGLVVRGAAIALKSVEDRKKIDTSWHDYPGDHLQAGKKNAIVFNPKKETYDLEIWRGPDGVIPKGMIEIEMLCKAMREMSVTEWPAFERAVERILEHKGHEASFTFSDVEEEMEEDFRRLEALEEKRQREIEMERAREESIARHKKNVARAKQRKAETLNKIVSMTQEEIQARRIRKVVDDEEYEETFDIDQVRGTFRITQRKAAYLEGGYDKAFLQLRREARDTLRRMGNTGLLAQDVREICEMLIWEAVSVRSITEQDGEILTILLDREYPKR